MGNEDLKAGPLTQTVAHWLKARISVLKNGGKYMYMSGKAYVGKTNVDKADHIP